MDDPVLQIKQALDGGIPEQLLIETLVSDGADPATVRQLIDQAKQKKAPDMTPPSRPSPRPSSESYSPIQGQPSSHRHVRQPNPDSDVKHIHEEATSQMNKINESYHNTEQTISELQVFMFLAKYLGWSLMIGDGIFSYWALKVALNNQWMAVYLAVGICAAIFIMGVAISIKSVDEIFVLDKDQNGSVSAGEKLWFCVRVFVAFVCVGTDVLTNFMGMDTLLARSIVPIPLFPGWLVSLFLAVAIMLLPQVIVSWGDVNMRKLSRLKPLARVEAAQTQADTNYATGVQRVYATSTTPIGERDAQKKIGGWKLGSKIGL